MTGTNARFNEVERQAASALALERNLPDEARLTPRPRGAATDSAD